MRMQEGGPVSSTYDRQGESNHFPSIKSPEYLPARMLGHHENRGRDRDILAPGDVFNPNTFLVVLDAQAVADFNRLHKRLVLANAKEVYGKPVSDGGSVKS